MCHSSFNNHKSIFVVWLFWGIVGFSAQQYRGKSINREMKFDNVVGFMRAVSM